MRTLNKASITIIISLVSVGYILAVIPAAGLINMIHQPSKR
jgi:hypothetical protein